MARLLRFQPDFQETMLAQRCYWKSRWADEWTEVPELWCSSAEWTCAPSISSAELEWRYGRVLSPGAAAFTARFREYQRARYLIKVEFDTHELQEGGGGDTLKWYGTLEIENDNQLGALQSAAGVWFANGKSFFTCYGLEQQLELVEVVTAKCVTPSGEDFVKRGLAFNYRGRANRSPGTGTDGSHLFLGDPLYVPEFWSSQQAVEYLLTHHLPLDHNGEAWFPLELSDASNVIPTWDKPELETHGTSVRSLLNTLISRDRLMTWRLDVTDDAIRVVPFSFTDEPIPLERPYGAYLAYNPNTIRIATERDRGASMVIKRSSLDAVDQIIAEGARRTSTATFSSIDGSLAAGWTSALQTEFNGGGVDGDNWPETDAELQAQYVINFRNRIRYQDVYRRFKMASTDGMVGNGTGGALDEPLMPLDSDPTQATPLAMDDWKFAPQLALKEGVNYEDLDNQTDTAEKPHEWLRPLVVFPIPLPDGETEPAAGARRYTNGDSASLTAALETVAFPVSLRSHCGKDDGCLYVDVMNGTQDMIASDDFTPIEEIDPENTGVSFRDMLATLTVEWSEYARGVYPETAAIGLDHARKMLVIAGESYRCDYLVPDTVIGLNADGTLQRCAIGGFVQDDRDKLRGIAQTAFAWYGQARHAIDFTTSLVTSAIKVGDYVTELGDPTIPGDIVTEDINSVVTSIRIDSRSIETDAGVPVTPSPPTMTVTTAFGELDVRRLVRL